MRSGSWACAPATPSATTRSSSAASASASSSSTARRAATASRAGRCAPRSGWRGGLPASTRCATCSGCERFTASEARGGDRPPRRGLPPPAARGAAAPGRLAARLFPHALLVRTHDNRALGELLTSGAADAILTDEAEADALAVPGAVRVGPFTRDRKGYLGRDPALVAELDAWLRAREADGTLAGLRARWLGRERARARSAFASDLDALVALVDLRLAFMPAVAAAKRKTGRPVEDPGQEARVLGAVRARAAERGLDPTAVEALFRAQIEAARHLEQEFLAHPEEADTLHLAREP